MTAYFQNGPLLAPPRQPLMREHRIVGPVELAVSVWTEEDRRPARALGDWGEVWRHHDCAREGVSP